MVSMTLFGEDDNQALLKELASYQIDTYGNGNILKIFRYVKSQGWLVPGSVIFEKLRSMANAYDVSHSRENIMCVLIGPLAAYVDANPTENDLITFYDLDFEAKRFVSQYPDFVPKLTDVLALSEAGLFSAMSGEACLLAIDCYGVDTLKKGRYGKANASIEILLKTWSKYRCGMPLEELIRYSEKISIQQALVLDILMEVGFTLEKLVDEFSSWNKLLLCLDVLYNISVGITRDNHGSIMSADFGMLLHYMYLQFDEEELQTLANMNRNTCSSVYLHGMFKYLESNQNYPDIKKDLQKLQYIPEDFSSVEIVVDGVSKVILPVDAAIDQSVWSLINSNFIGARSIAHELVRGDKDNKLVIYVCKAVNRLIMVGEKSFNFSLYMDDSIMNGGLSDEFDPGGLLDTLFNSLTNAECMFDMRMFEFFKANIKGYEKEYGKYLNCPVDLRVTMYLASRSYYAGNTEYLQLLRREDQGVTLFRMLAAFIRPDDSFYAAMFRYQLALLKIPFVKYNRKLNVNEELVLDGKTFNTMNILAGDKSLVEYLQGCDIEKVLADLG